MCFMPARCWPSACSPNGPIAASCVRWVACSHCSTASSARSAQAPSRMRQPMPTVRARRVRCARSRSPAKIVTAECFQCLDCQVEYYDDDALPAAGARAKLRGEQAVAQTAMRERDHMRRTSTRRRALRIVAAVAGLPLMIAGVRATAPKLGCTRWHGEVLGALSELTLWHPDAAFARRSILKARHEIERFEHIFSLYRRQRNLAPQSRRQLVEPSPELRDARRGKPTPRRAERRRFRHFGAAVVAHCTRHISGRAAMSSRTSRPARATSRARWSISAACRPERRIASAARHGHYAERHRARLRHRPHRRPAAQ